MNTVPNYGNQVKNCELRHSIIYIRTYYANIYCGKLGPHHITVIKNLVLTCGFRFFITWTSDGVEEIYFEISPIVTNVIHNKKQGKKRRKSK